MRDRAIQYGLADHATARGAFTLVESVISLVIMAVVLAAATSITYAAARGIPKSTDPNTQKIESQGVIAQLVLELEQAVTFTGSTSGACLFTVADPDDPTELIDIGYTWSGTAGDSLYRITRDEKREILSDGAALAFTYDVGESGLTRRVRRVTIEVARVNSKGTTAHGSVRLPVRPEVY